MEITHDEIPSLDWCPRGAGCSAEHNGAVD